jgi:hypothetical protein
MMKHQAVFRSKKDLKKYIFHVLTLTRLSPFDDIFAFFEAEKSKNTNVFGG